MFWAAISLASLAKAEFFNPNKRGFESLEDAVVSELNNFFRKNISKYTAKTNYISLIPALSE